MGGNLLLSVLYLRLDTFTTTKILMKLKIGNTFSTQNKQNRRSPVFWFSQNYTRFLSKNKIIVSFYLTLYYFNAYNNYIKTQKQLFK